MKIEAVNSEWLLKFHKREGHAPRVLHIGNIANNAYLNAKFLNNSGFDCDVICHDYYHIMACPEWEDANFEVEGLDHFAPNWTNAKISGFVRPDWFVQGPADICLDYLIAKRSGNVKAAKYLWHRIGFTNGTRNLGSSSPAKPYLVDRVDPLFAATKLRFMRLGAVLGFIIRSPDALDVIRKKFLRLAGVDGTIRYFVINRIVIPAFLIVGSIMRVTVPTIRYPFINRSQPQIDRFLARFQVCVDRFAQIFPDRKDQLAMEDCLPYLGNIGRWEELFSYYDVIQAYATSVTYPLLAGNNSYVGFEHGTLRDFTLADNAISRLTSLGYQNANHVLITNGDCLAYAKHIKVEAYTPMVHPVDDARIFAVTGDYEELHQLYGVKYLFICPLRHDWQVKGTDKYIRALPALAQKLNGDFRLLMTKWGTQVEESKQLAAKLGVADLVAWIDPLNRSQMIKLQKSVDIVFDQIALPHFGATAPQAIAAGVPVIMSYDHAATKWIIPQQAPIISAWTDREIVSGVTKALDPKWRMDYKNLAAEWYAQYHSSSIVVDKLSRVYRDIIENKLKELHHEPR